MKNFLIFVLAFLCFGLSMASETSAKSVAPSELIIKIKCDVDPPTLFGTITISCEGNTVTESIGVNTSLEKTVKADMVYINLHKISYVRDLTNTSKKIGEKLIDGYLRYPAPKYLIGETGGFSVQILDKNYNALTDPIRNYEQNGYDGPYTQDQLKNVLRDGQISVRFEKAKGYGFIHVPQYLRDFNYNF
jgi:hypothetical protein